MISRTLTFACLLYAGVFGARLPKLDVEIGDVFKAIENGVKFFSEDYSSINVDGLFGLRLGQGQIREALRECREKSCDHRILNSLTSIDERLGTTCDRALPYVEASDPAYYNRFIQTINKPYITPYLSTSLQEAEVKIGSRTDYDEERGDTCYSRMLGTYQENGKLLPQCNITSDCWNYMTTEMTAGYTITHQLLFFIIIEHVGCRESVEMFIENTKVRTIQERLCNKIYAEAKSFEDKGKVKATKKDLFLEQTLLCGPLGFENFMRPDWMKMVLTWQDKKDGCFKVDYMEAIIEAEAEIDRTSQEKQDKTQSEDAEKSDSKTMRKLLREKVMKDGCLAHESGLGFGVLSSYLRYLLRTM